MKKKTLLSSIVSICLSFSLIAGATYALFTSRSEVNIAVTSGTVSVVANVDESSVQTKKLYDTEYSQGKDNMYGGVATFTESSLTLETLLPGDGIKFDIVVSNKSNVVVQYRTIISCVNDNGLFSGLNINIGMHRNYNSVRAVSNWEELKVGVQDAIVPIEIVLPENAGNEYQNKTCTITYVVEAVQGNATTIDVDGNNKTTAEKIISDANGNSAKIPVDTSIKSGNLGISLDVKDLDENETANVQTGLFELSADGKAFAYNVKVPEVDEDNQTAIVVSIKAQAGLTGVVLLFHEGIPMTSVDSVDAVDEDNEFFYDAISGVVTFATNDFSNFTLASGFEDLAVVTSATTYGEIVAFIAEGKDIYVTENINLTGPDSINRITVNNAIAIHSYNDAVITMNRTTLFVGTGSITICNGSIKMSQEFCVTDNTTMIFEGGEHTFGAFSATSNGKIVINGGTFNCKGSYASVMGMSFCENGTLILNDGLLNMYQPFNVNQDRCDRAYIEINGGVIDLLNGIENLFVTRNVIDKDREEGGTLRGSVIRINGGVFIAHYEVDSAGDATSFIRNGDGTAIGNRVLVSNADGYDCLVTGGTFYGSWQRADNMRYEGSDGKFIENSIAGFVADGYQITGDPDKGYVVSKI